MKRVGNFVATGASGGKGLGAVYSFPDSRANPLLEA